MAEKKQYDVVIIGAGPGGYAAAFKAADLGLKTALIDPEKNPGGVCLHRGCIPSKALLHLTKLKNEALLAEKFGIKFSEPEINVDRVREWKNEVVNKLTGGLGQLAKTRKVDHVRGWAKFIDSGTLEVNNEEENHKVQFKHAIIATGSDSMPLPGVDLESDRLLYSAKALGLEQIPEKLLIIGAGYIGLEMGSVYAALGSKVSLVEMTEGFLPGADKDLVKVFEKSNADLFENTFFNSKVTEIEEKEDKLTITFENKEGDKDQVKFDQVMVAVGRKPKSEGIGLDNTNVETDDKGFIKVDLQRKTSDDHIYAIGDVAGEPMLAHKATHEGHIAAEAIAGEKTAYEPKAIPAVVFTDPEIAWCGLTESEAKEQGREIKIAKFPWAASGRAATLGTTHGLTKLVIDPETERILGVGIAGKHAGDMIPEAVLAVEMAALASDLSLTIHPHPTLSETIMEAAEAFYGISTHYYSKKKKK